MSTEQDSSVNWRKKLLTGLCVIAILGVSMLFYYSNQPSYVRNYCGIYWNDSWSGMEPASQPVRVQFSGTKYENGEFEGDITIYSQSDSSILFEWNGVAVCKEPDRGEFYIVPIETFIDYKEAAEPHYSTLVWDCVACMVADNDWNAFTIGPKPEPFTSLGVLPGITCPAQTIEEAMVIVEELSLGTRFQIRYPDE